MPPSLREEKKRQLRERIVDAALALVRDKGLDGTTADDIAAAAQIGRATFFRYFESREAAIVIAFYEKRLTVLADTLARAPAELAPVDAIVWACRELERDFSERRDILLLQGRLLRESSSLRARAMEYQAGYEETLARAVARRFRSPGVHDPRPRLLAAAALAVIRSVVEQWVDMGGRPDVRVMVREALQQLRAGFPA